MVAPTLLISLKGNLEFSLVSGKCIALLALKGTGGRKRQGICGECTALLLWKKGRARMGWVSVRGYFTSVARSRLEVALP